MESRNKILDKAKKLKELAERGIEGEKENAKMMLERYMTKHNISDAEISSHKQSENFRYENMTDEQFIELIIIEFIPIGISSIFLSFGNEQDKAKANSDANKFLNKFLHIVSERLIKKNK